MPMLTFMARVNAFTLCPTRLPTRFSNLVLPHWAQQEVWRSQNHGTHALSGTDRIAIRTDSLTRKGCALRSEPPRWCWGGGMVAHVSVHLSRPGCTSAQRIVSCGAPLGLADLIV